MGDQGPSNPGNSPKSGLGVVYRNEVAEERAARKVRSWMGGKSSGTLDAAETSKELTDNVSFRKKAYAQCACRIEMDGLSATK